MRCHDTCCNPEPEIAEVMVLSRRFVKATRKPHTCDYCGTEISVGSPANVVNALLDGSFWSGYRHVNVNQCDGI
jgi:hypothetical protein